MSTFGTLNTGVSGLRAAQRAMDVTGQNVVNSSTPGYSRQRVELASVGNASTATYHSGNPTSAGGVRVEDVVRIHDAFLEATRAAAGGQEKALSAQNDVLSNVETLVSEPTDSGLQTTMDGFFSSWQDLATNISDDPSAAGAVVLEQGAAVTDQLHTLANGVASEWSTTYQRLSSNVDQINQAASDLATLNGKIRQAQASGSQPNELLDQRDTLVRSLADLAGGVASTSQDGQFSVSVGGISLVNGSTAQKLTLTGGATYDEATTNPPTVTWNNLSVPIDSGSSAGYLAALRTDLPNVGAQLDQVAVALKNAVNSVHTSGFTLSGTAGGNFFSGTGARDIAVAVTSADDLAVSATAGKTDGSIAQKIGDLSTDSAQSAALGGGTGSSELWRKLTTGLGTKVQSLSSAITVQQSVVSTADDAVSADSGVSLDEEMTNMLQYQRSYQASARVITAVDEMLNTLINSTGQVGR